MKIALVSTILGFSWGSPDRLWTELARRCLDRGDAVFLGISPLTAAHPSVEHLCKSGAEIFLRKQNSIFLGNRDALARSLPWRRKHYLENSLARFKPDFVFLTQGASYDSLAEHHLVAWLRATATPYAIICHCNKEDAKPTDRDIPAIRQFYAAAARVFFVSSHNLQLAGRHLGVTLPNAGIIQNPLSATVSATIPYTHNSGVPLIGTVGRLDPAHKGLDLLLEAVGGLPPGSLRLVLTGSSPDPDYLSSLVRLNKLDDCVEIRPPVPPNEVPRTIAGLELFLLTSRYEGCASAMIEAMMCGRPVLATPVGGVSDWIGDGVDGYVAADCTAESIRRTLIKALADRPRWPALGAAARARFEKQRDPDPVGALLAQIDSGAFLKS